MNHEVMEMRVKELVDNVTAASQNFNELYTSIPSTVRGADLLSAAEALSSNLISLNVLTMKLQDELYGSVQKSPVPK